MPQVFTAEDLLEMPLSSLAYLGDAIYELFIRERVVHANRARSGSLFRAALPYVRAEGQAAALEHLLPELSVEEEALCRRARNHTPLSRPRHCDPVVYRKATALEVLCASLYLQNKQERLLEILEESYAHIRALGGVQAEGSSPEL